MKNRLRNQALVLAGAGVVLGIVTWTFGLHQFDISQGSGWAIALLAYSIGVNLLAVGVYAALMPLGYRTGLITPSDQGGLRNRIALLFFALVALALTFVVARLVQPVLIKPKMFEVQSTDFVATPGIIPLLGLIILMIVLAAQPILKRLRSTAGPRKTVLTVALIAGLLPLLPFLVFNTPLRLLVWIVPSYGWFTDLRKGRPIPENDLVVVEVKGAPSWDLVRFLHSYNPSRIVLLPSPSDLQNDFLDNLNKISRPDAKIFLQVSDYSHSRAPKPFPNITFAGFGSIWRTPVAWIYDERGALTAPFLLATERNKALKVQSLEKFQNADGHLLAEDYSKFQRVTIEAVAEAEGNNWKFSVERWTRLWSEYRVIPGKGVDSVLKQSESWTLDSLSGKTIIVDFFAKYAFNTEENQPSFGGMFARVLLSAEHGQFRRVMSSRTTGLIGLLLLLINAACYYRTRPWIGFGLALLMNALAFGMALLLYTESSLIIFLTPMAFSIGILTVILFPYELFRERSQNLEERTRLATELKAAREMQMGLMPKEDPSVRGFDISGICLPTNEVGGDFFDYVWLDKKKTKLGIALADVSGKAMKAAMTAVMTSGMIYREAGGNQSPKTILRNMNRPLYTKLDSRMFTALSFAVIDTRKKELRFSNAGQSYPLLKRGKEVKSLEVKGARLPLGVKEDVTYGEMAVKLKKGDTLIFYTDGIPEAKDEKDQFYGFDRFKSLMENLGGLLAKEMRDRILSEVKSFTGNAPQHDDMTVVVVKVN